MGVYILQIFVIPLYNENITTEQATQSGTFKPEENKGKCYNQRKIENWVSFFLQYYGVMFHCLIDNANCFNKKKTIPNSFASSIIYD